MNADIIGHTPQIAHIHAMIQVAANSNEPVLIQGESGTGKELVARAICAQSLRKAAPFVAISCAMLSPTLLESELFGYEKGAFTGAYQAKPGKLELAHGGTLFLDDVDDIPLELQVKLVRVLQEFQFERVGGIQPRNVDMRLISASKRDLAKMVEEGTFRDDLYYRLKILFIALPPLRERRQDIPLLVAYFLKRHGTRPMGMDTEALETLMTYDWPGNVRELENTVRRMVVTSQSDTLGVHHIPHTIRYKRVMKMMQTPSESIPFEQLVRETERQLILMALERADWNKSRTAEMLDMKRTTLISKMKRLNIPMEKP